MFQTVLNEIILVLVQSPGNTQFIEIIWSRSSNVRTKKMSLPREEQSMVQPACAGAVHMSRFSYYEDTLIVGVVQE